MGFSTTKRNLMNAKIVKGNGGVLVAGKNESPTLKKKNVRILNRYGELVIKSNKIRRS